MNEMEGRIQENILTEMRIIFVHDVLKTGAVIKSARSEGQVPRINEWVSATDKDGMVSGYVRMVEWKYESLDGPEVKVFLFN